jgi:ubiquinone/menaquinone biosynthesis C-methylase UbiE
MLAVARACSVKGPLSYVRGVAEALPFADGVFDAVLVVTTLEFVGDVEAALREAVRVITPGGRLVAGVLNSEGSWAAARRRSGGRLWKAARFFSETDIRALLKPFGDVKAHRAVYVPAGMARLPSCVFPLIEWLGFRIVPPAGAFIAARVDIRRSA